MKVALYYPWIYLRSGCERTIAQLVSHSRHDWTIFTSCYEPESTFPELNQLNIVPLDKVPVKRSFGQVAKAAARIAFTRLPLQDHAALFVFCEGLGDLITLRNRRVPAACLCFTPLRAVFDPHYQSNYLEMNGNGLLRRTLLHGVGAIFRVVDRFLWRHYDAVFAISSEVRERIVRGGLRRREDVELAHPGVTVSDFHPTGEYSRTFVIPGRIMWTKNIELGIAAFKRFLSNPANAAFSLVIAGFVDVKSKPYIAKLRALAVGFPNIRFVERPSDEELFAICSSAYAILYTPFNEDWGLVPLEAMCLEKPVISVNRGGPTELMIDGETGFLVPAEPAAFASAMQTLADDPALVARMGVAGRARAAAFDWRQFAAKIDAYIDGLTVKEEVAAYAFKSAH